MSVIAELSLPADEFHLGRILRVQEGTRVMLESIVPVGDKSVPFVRVFEGRDSFESAVSKDSAVEEIRLISEHDEELLYALDWDITHDDFFEGVIKYDGTVMAATGSETRWGFELRFEEHEELSDFMEFCKGNGLNVSVDRLYNPTKPDAGPWYGLTSAQRTALLRAVEAGYYAIPRETSTSELASEFGIGSQAMTERLRRAVTNLVTNTIQVSEEMAKQPD